MSDYISREQADQKLEIAFLGLDRKHYNIAKDLFNHIPSADVRENIKGEWIYQQGIVPYKWRCNRCEKMFKTDFNFCPNCGADMRGE